MKRVMIFYECWRADLKLMAIRYLHEGTIKHCHCGGHPSRSPVYLHSWHSTLLILKQKKRVLIIFYNCFLFFSKMDWNLPVMLFQCVCVYWKNWAQKGNRDWIGNNFFIPKLFSMMPRQLPSKSVTEIRNGKQLTEFSTFIQSHASA